MTDGALSWLAMVAARYFADGAAAAARRPSPRGRARLLPARTRAPTAGSRSARWSRSSGAAFCRGVGPRGPDRAPVRARRLATTHAEVEAIFAGAHARASGRRSPASTTAAWSRCSSSTRRWTPSSCARARWSSSSSSRAPSRCGCSAARSSCRARRRDAGGGPARRSASTPTRCCARRGYGDDEIAALHEPGAVAGPPGTVPQGSFLA